MSGLSRPCLRSDTADSCETRRVDRAIPIAWKDSLAAAGGDDRNATPGPAAAECCLRAGRSPEPGRALWRVAGAHHALPRGVLQGKAGAGVHHWRAPGVDGGDDLLRGDALQVGAGRGEVRVPQLALDQRQRDPLMQQLDSVRMAQLVGREAPTDARLKRDLVQLQPGGAGRPGVAARWVRRSRKTTGRPAASRARTAKVRALTIPRRPSRPGGGDRSCRA